MEQADIWFFSPPFPAMHTELRTEPSRFLLNEWMNKEEEKRS